MSGYYAKKRITKQQRQTTLNKEEQLRFQQQKENKNNFLNEIKRKYQTTENGGIPMNSILEIATKYNIKQKSAKKFCNATFFIYDNLVFFTSDDINKHENRKYKEFYEKFPSKDDYNHCCYRFRNENGNIIYIGRAKNLLDRMKTHEHLPSECYEEVFTVEYVKFETEDDLDIAERYYISKYKPKYNTEFKNKNFSFNISFLDDTNWKKLNNKHSVNIIKANNNCSC